MGLFNRRKDNEDEAGGSVMLGGGKKTLAAQPNTPPAALSEGAGQFAEIYGSSMVQSHRMFLVAIIAMLLALVGVLAVVVVMPLKEVRPWVVEVNPDTGVVNKPVEVQKITPNVAVIKGELARWAEAVYTIDSVRTPELFKFANARTRDKAIAQFTEFRIAERTFERLQREPNLSREARVTSVDASQKEVAFVFLTTTERGGSSGAGDVLTKRFRLTLHYTLDPATQEADLLRNPLGLYVTFFNASEERVN